MGIYGQDWASYQAPAPDTTGLAFAFIKVTEGLGYTNLHFAQQRTHAQASGLVVGLYHYPHMGQDPVAEADYFLKTAQPKPGEIIVLDWEGYDDANKAVPKARQVQYRDAWLRHVKAALPHTPVGLYANLDYWLHVDTSSNCGDFLWIATAGRPAGAPGIKHDWLFHQYAETGGLDRDYCHLTSTAALRAWVSGFQPKPAPTPTPPPYKAPPFPAGLAPGKSSPSAVPLQKALRTAGFLTISDGDLADDYGPRTQAAVAKFLDAHPQFKSKGKVHDVAIGPQGWAYLFTLAYGKR